MANSQVFAPTRRVKSQTDVSRRFHADRATVVLPPFELSTGELPPVRQSRLLSGSCIRKTRNCKGLRKKARSPSRWAPGSALGSRVAGFHGVSKRVQVGGGVSPAKKRRRFSRRFETRSDGGGALVWCKTGARHSSHFAASLRRQLGGGRYLTAFHDNARAIPARFGSGFS